MSKCSSPENCFHNTNLAAISKHPSLKKYLNSKNDTPLFVKLVVSILYVRKQLNYDDKIDPFHKRMLEADIEINDQSDDEYKLILNKLISIASIVVATLDIDNDEHKQLMLDKVISYKN